MNYYKRHLGDYAKKAGHLSTWEHGAYTLILDAYYDRELAPTLEEAFLNLTLFQLSEVHVEILNEIGQQVQLVNAQILEAGIQTISLNAANLAKGVNFLRVSINKQESTHKLIKL